MSEVTRESVLERIAPDVKKNTYLSVYAEPDEWKLIGIGMNNTVLAKHAPGAVENFDFEEVKGMRLE